MRVFLPLRDDAPRGRLPLATLALIATNMVVFLAQQALSSDGAASLLYAGGAIPWEISRLEDLVDGGLHPKDMVPPPFTIVTSLFLHGGPAHLLGNLWFLWIFGDNVEAAMGGRRFVLFYLLLGVLAAVAQVIMTPSSKIPVVGASGAIAGVLGAYFALYPRARVEVLLVLLVVVEIVVVPAFFVLGVWFLWQLIAGSGDGTVAIWAHVWGFLLGAAACKLLARRGPPTASEPARPLGRTWMVTPAAGSSSSPA